MKAPLLVELRTEELPPKALLELSKSFAASIFEELAALGLASGKADYRSDLATPRRLAVLIPDVSDQAACEQFGLAHEVLSSADGRTGHLSRWPNP